MTTDVDFASSERDRQRVELQREELELERRDPLVGATITEEQILVRRIKAALMIAVPAGVMLLVGLIALAIALSGSGTGFAAPLGMAAGDRTPRRRLLRRLGRLRVHHP